MARGRSVVLVAVASLACSASVSAHHSFAMFDAQKDVVILGTVTGFEWTNPHVWIHVDAADGRQWAIEAPSVVNLTRLGWSRSLLKAGDKVTLTVNPLRNGEAGASFKGMVLSDGRTFGAPWQK